MQLPFPFDTTRAVDSGSAARGVQVEFVRLDEASPVRQWVAMPPICAVVPGASRHSRRGLMVEFTRAGIWFFRGPLTLRWDDVRLAHAAELCAEALRDTPFNLGLLAQRLCESFDAALEVHLPTLDRDAVELWNPRAFALAQVLQSLVSAQGGEPPALPPGLSARVDALEQTNGNELAAALHAFGEGLDREILPGAQQQGCLSARRYNLLTGGCPLRQRHRLQFATTFPVLLEGLLAEKPPAGFPRELLRVIDGGQPAVSFLAEAFGGRKHTVRHLIGRPQAEVGTRWAAAPARLLAILDAMPPEIRPRDAASWQRLNMLVPAADRALRRPAQPAIAAAWYRTLDCEASAGAHVSLSELASQAPPVSEFLSALVDCLRWRGFHGDDPAAIHGVASAQTLAEGVIARLSWKGTVSLASAWRRAAHACRAEFSDTCERLLGRRYAALLPRPITLGERKFVALVTPEELAAEGRALDHCVGEYNASCLSGSSYIVSVRAREDGSRRSTAEFSIHMDGLGPVRVNLRQHHSAADSPPESACVTAVRSLLIAFETPEMQEHLRQLVLQRSRIGRLTGVDALRLATLLPNEEAFRRILRPRGSYERLLARMGPSAAKTRGLAAS